jgi:hypothetical protein
MYKSSKTKDGEFPRTARETLSHSFSNLEARFPERTIGVYGAECCPAYEWDGAGSEKGGSAGIVSYDKIIFIPHEDNKNLVVSVGDKNEDRYAFPDYSLLLMQTLPNNLADTLIDFYKERAEQHPDNYRLFSPLRKILQDGTHSYHSAFIFAIDGDQGDRFYTNPRGSLNAYDLERFQENDKLKFLMYAPRELEERLKFSENLTDFAATYDKEKYRIPIRRGLEEINHPEKIIKELWKLDNTMKLPEGLDEMIRSTEVKINEIDTKNKELDEQMKAEIERENVRIKLSYSVKKLTGKSDEEEKLRKFWNLVNKFYSS